MSERVAILGGGSWGLAISHVLAQQDCEIVLWEHIVEDYNRLVETGGNPDKLPDFSLDESIRLTDDLVDAVSEAAVVVLAVPAQYLRSVISKVAGPLAQGKVIVNLAKGIETDTLMRMSEVIAEVTGAPTENIVTLSGPSHAEEVVLDMPTTVVAAGKSSETSARVQELFSVGSFRVYQSHDIIGVELGGSLKNIVAIAAGMADGLSMGDNTKGALITRGLAEIVRLGLACGARADTFAGLSGVGDLVTTCFSRHSRNRFVGQEIGKGRKLDDVLVQMKMVAEGVQTARSGYELARRYQVEMPITEQVYQVLFKDRSVDEAVVNLMGRTLKAEIWN